MRYDTCCSAASEVDYVVCLCWYHQGLLEEQLGHDVELCRIPLHSKW